MKLSSSTLLVLPLLSSCNKEPEHKPDAPKAVHQADYASAKKYCTIRHDLALETTKACSDRVEGANKAVAETLSKLNEPTIILYGGNHMPGIAEAGSKHGQSSIIVPDLYKVITEKTENKTVDDKNIFDQPSQENAIPDIQFPQGNYIRGCKDLFGSN